MEEKTTVPATAENVIWGFVRKQGAIVAMLGIAVYWMYGRVEKADARIEKSDVKIEVLNTYIRTELKTTLDDNTRMLEKVKDKIRE